MLSDPFFFFLLWYLCFLVVLFLSVEEKRRFKNEKRRRKWMIACCCYSLTEYTVASLRRFAVCVGRIRPKIKSARLKWWSRRTYRAEAKHPNRSAVSIDRRNQSQRQQEKTIDFNQGWQALQTEKNFQKINQKKSEVILKKKKINLKIIFRLAIAPLCTSCLRFDLLGNPIGQFRRQSISRGVIQGLGI